MSAEQVVNDFCAAIGRKDQAAAMGLVAEDCYYDNVPIGHMVGHEKMLEVLGPMFSSPDAVEFEILRQTATGNMVMNERIDRFILAGKQIELPVMGVFEVNENKITFWRDYFDQGTFRKQMS